MEELFKSIEYLDRIGKKRLEKYQRLGISTPYDLLCYYPRNYIDFSSPVLLKDCKLGQKNVVKGIVKYKNVTKTSRFTIYKIFLLEAESSQEFCVVIFNNVYASDVLIPNREYIFYGKLDMGYSCLEMNSPLVISANDPVKFQSIYHLTAGLTNPMVHANLKQCLNLFDRSPFETLTEDVIDTNGLMSFQEAIHLIHFPYTKQDIVMARRRLAFEELLLLQLGMLLMKSNSRSHTGCTMDSSISIDEFYTSIPFTMTDGQQHAIDDIISDMCKDIPMNRLIQGDVGSGKTAVSVASCYFAHKNGFQSTIMAPTEILALQHFKTFSEMLEPLGVKIGLLVGSLPTKAKKLTQQYIESGRFSVVIGTHALIQKDVNFKNLGLVITDEQHRFGVAQRSKLSSKGNYPHKLVMSATPIPRTLGLMIYGDLDISIINELPKGRKPIDTFAVSGRLRMRAYNYLAKEILSGGQAYIVCPTIEEGDNDLNLKSVETYYEVLKGSALEDFNIGYLHGKMSQEEKEYVMNRFKNGKIDVLVSTTVIEVGVDVPNASIILIENADRFGLSQLHQLRGRVGRGTRKSSCILVTDNVTEDVKARLNVICQNSDGFKIAEEDLKLRGCGDFFGNRQHGLPSLRIADLINDMELLDSAKDTAYSIIQEDSTLSSKKYASLRTEILRMFENSSSN